MSQYPWERVDVPGPTRGHVGFPAMYRGQCGAGDEIDEGDMIRSYAGEYWHVECADDDAADPAVCPDCNTVHAGECW